MFMFIGCHVSPCGRHGTVWLLIIFYFLETTQMILSVGCFVLIKFLEPCHRFKTFFVEWFLWSYTHNLISTLYCVAVQVREATSNDPWGPSSSLMSEIADLTYNVVAFSEIMSMVWKRLNDHGKNWRHVYKVRVTIFIRSSFKTIHGSMCLVIQLCWIDLLELLKLFSFVILSQCYGFWSY